MKKGKKLYEGKAKIIFATNDKNTIIQHFKDDATAFNAKKIKVLDGKGEINDDYKAGKIATFGRKQTKDPNTGKMVTKVKGGVLTVDQYANFLDGVKQRTGTPLDKKGDQNYMKTEFMKKCTKAWFDEEVEIDTSSGAAFKKDWATKVFDYYKRMNGHEGILLVDKQGNYRYFVEGSQLAPEDLQLRSLYWTNQRGQSRGDKPGFKEVNKRKK